ncbi:restriction endonuclease subunit S [Prescottella subtropica]|uniref:restriction endonuclease subunit S n=1 Tax=Prescottella subtropica TaxID=2545757 RepID=UPI0010F7687F|nr:restriction endonuclease subunit S [Prescottella subtropica]
MSWPAYAEYAESGIDWLTQVPASWRIERMRNIFTKMQRPYGEDAETVTAFRDGTVTRRSNRRTDGFTEADKYIGYQGIEPGDLAIHAMDGFAGAIGVSDSQGKCSPVVSVCRASGLEDPHYFAHILRHIARSGFLTAIAKGIRERSTDFRWADARDICVPCPPIEEQQAIAVFLDRETAKIDALIVKQEQLIATLREDRAATITQAVMKGLDPNAAMKDSGTSWLGSIPEDWTACRLGRLCRSVSDGPHFSPAYVDESEGVMFLSARNIKVDGWSLADSKFISEDDYVEFSRRVVPELGDVLYTKGGTTGIARAVDIEGRFQVWVHVAVLKLIRGTVTPEYLAYALNSAPCYEQSQLYTRGATNKDLGLSRMVRIQLALPPVQEQQEIVDFLDDRCANVDALIVKSTEVIGTLREYRSALITDAVTGKIDVRGAVVEEANILVAHGGMK